MNEIITIVETTSIKQAMKLLNTTGKNCLLVIDENNKLLGTLTDGDLRRVILKGLSYQSSIKEIYNKTPFVLEAAKFSDSEAGKIMTSEKINLLPILNSDGKLVDYITWEQLFGKESTESGEVLNVPVVIIAGGKGTRLEPFTKVLPKPLIPIHEKPIIEHILERFNELGCSDFYLTVNYKSKIMKAYFEELQPEYNVDFVYEKEPLGTAGSLHFLKERFNQPIFVTNCDIIIKVDYASIYKFHEKGGYDITLVASTKEYVIPYGTCELNDEGHLSRINEKPHYDFLINTGLYVLNPDVLKIIPENKFYHFTHLIEDAKNNGKKVGVYPIDDDAWVDIGQLAEFQKEVEKL